MKLLRIRFADGTFHTCNLGPSGNVAERTRHAALAYVYDPTPEGRAKAERVATALGGMVEEYEQRSLS